MRAADIFPQSRRTVSLASTVQGEELHRRLARRDHDELRSLRWQRRLLHHLALATDLWFKVENVIFGERAKERLVHIESHFGV
jgi:hypothetical protein